MNAKGFYESQVICRLNEEILASAGTNWLDWKVLNQEWHESPSAAQFRDRALSVLAEEYPDSRLLVLKDPRICRLVPFWAGVLQAAGYKPLFLHTHRHPLEVAASLQRRDGIEPGYGQLLWLRHVLSAEADSRGLARCFTSYNELMRNWPGVIERTQEALHLRFPRAPLSVASEISSFLSVDLRHHEQTEAGGPDNLVVSTWVREAFAILERWVASGETNDDCRTLNSILIDLDSSIALFGKSLDQGRRSAQLTRKLRQELDLRNAELTRLQDWQQETAESQARGVAQQALLESRERTISQQKKLLVHLETALSDHDQTIADQREQLQTLEHIRHAVLSSTTWRLTAPVRRLIDLLKSMVARIF